VHLQIVMGGETVHLKELDSGSYIVCLAGAAGREKCQSIDLNTPGRRRSHDFSVTLHVPTASEPNRDRYKVASSTLSVPRNARRELVSSEKAELNGEREVAREHLERALEIFPDYPDALNNLGAIYHRTGEYEKAVGLFSKATGIDPGCYAAWINLAGSLTTLARFDEGMAAVQKALALRPDAALANSTAGLIYYYKRDFARAKPYFEKALATDPASNNAPQLYLAHIALGERRTADAQAYFRSYLKLHPNAPNADGLRRTLMLLESGVPVIYGASAN